MEYDTTLAKQAYALAEKWDSARETPASKLPFSPDDIKSLNSNQKSAYPQRISL